APSRRGDARCARSTQVLSKSEAIWNCSTAPTCVFATGEIMQLTIVLEQRFRQTPDGRCWTESTSSRSFWSRYLTVFDGLKIVARVHDVSTVPDTWNRVDGVSDVELPDAAFAATDRFSRPTPPGVDGGQRRRFHVAFVGALEVGYKALDVLIEAVATCVRAGLDAELTILGTGRQRSL